MAFPSVLPNGLSCGMSLSATGCWPIVRTVFSIPKVNKSVYGWPSLKACSSRLTGEETWKRGFLILRAVEVLNHFGQYGDGLMVLVYYNPLEWCVV